MTWQGKKFFANMVVKRILRGDNLGSSGWALSAVANVPRETEEEETQGEAAVAMSPGTGVLRQPPEARSSEEWVLS